MKKVFCKNCKWCKYRWCAPNIEYAEFCKLKFIVDVNGVGHTSIDLSKAKCIGLNQDFNCPSYKRKWWKFWIR